jgi:hypothetical protein
MKSFARLVILLSITLSIPSPAFAQDLSTGDKEKLKLARIAADRFVERFAQTQDFKVAWKEFHMSDISCTIKTNGFFSLDDYRRLNLEDELIERFYVAVMNYYYLKAVHDVHFAPLNSEFSEEEITPKEILLAEKNSTYVKTNAKEPDSAAEAEQMIVEMRRFAKLYRKYTPRNVMRSPAWRAKVAPFEGEDVPDSRRIMNGRSDFCVPDNVKIYIVQRGIFYFYFVEENGSMRVAGLAFLID